MSYILHSPIQQDDRRVLAPRARHAAIMLLMPNQVGFGIVKKKKDVGFLFEFLLLSLLFSGMRASIIRPFLIECLHLSVWQVNTLITTSN